MHKNFTLNFSQLFLTLTISFSVEKHNLKISIQTGNCTSLYEQQKLKLSLHQFFSKNTELYNLRCLTRSKIQIQQQICLFYQSLQSYVCMKYTKPTIFSKLMNDQKQTRPETAKTSVNSVIRSNPLNRKINSRKGITLARSLSNSFKNLYLDSELVYFTHNQLINQIKSPKRKNVEHRQIDVGRYYKSNPKPIAVSFNAGISDSILQMSTSLKKQSIISPLNEYFSLDVKQPSKKNIDESTSNINISLISRQSYYS